jgi:LPS-assembly lipoprotein
MMRIRPWPKRLRPLLLLAPLVLGACGFHLQGRTQLPRSLASARLEARDQQSDFYAALRASLLASGARLDAPAADAATIHILGDDVSEQVLTVSATRNIPTAFLLSYRVRVSVDYQGRELLAPELHTVTREYSFDERALLAKQREREVLQQALADDLAALVMRRLAAL